jgi:hypothetical protein
METREKEGGRDVGDVLVLERRIAGTVAPGEGRAVGVWAEVIAVPADVL